jgi:outer membrane biosynthesis protein TonB
MATDDQGNTYSKVIMDAAANIPVIKAMVVAGKAASKVAEKVKDMLDDDKIVPKKKPPPDIKPKPKPEPDIKPKLKPKPPRDERAKRNPFRLSSDRQPGIETANTKAGLGSIKKNIMSYQSAENAHTSDWVSRMAVKAAIAMEK